VRRQDFEHVIRAAAAIVDDDLVVVGSQAVLGQFPNAPAALLRSLEVDLYPRNEPGRAEEIDAAIGDGSRFHETNAYYAHGVGPETIIAPAGWEDRLVRVAVPASGRRKDDAMAWCLEVHDLVLAKLAAGRPHDLDFATEAVRAGLVMADQLRLGVELIPASHRELTGDRLAAVMSAVSPSRAPANSLKG
jgi:hypothetical protein